MPAVGLLFGVLALLDIDAVLFDFGGTLLEFHREEIMRALLKEKGITADSKSISDAYEIVIPSWNALLSASAAHKLVTDEALRNLDRMVIQHLGIKVNLDGLADYVQENWDRVDRQLPKNLVRNKYPDVTPCLEAISARGLELGIVSNIQSEERLRDELEGIKLLQYFPVLIASGSIGVDKPSREIFDRAANTLGLEPGKIMFVGDDLDRDYYGSHEAGMNPVLIDRDRKYVADASLNRVTSLEQIPELL